MSDADQPQRAQEAVQKLPHAPPHERPVIYPDADEHNANWLRILAQRRKEQQQDEQQQKEPPTNG